ncbi:unnamed protein product [Wuchereria bancrofti]|uniref:Uncharacterized protein n=1 Tax=Wuchereria bancrofti TaxID=6293 RepID=A0A3P7E3I1_WUCBA|nr:unnamed protein product [Wuchereria bancrofti]
MANIPIWNGSSTFTTGSTPFGFYDNDVQFQLEADEAAKWCAIRLGWPIVNVELQSGSFYAALEEAITTYGNEVYLYKTRENFLSMEGNILTGITFNNKLITPNLGTVIRIADNYASEAGVGGYTTYHTGSITLLPGVQDYDLNAWASGSGISGSGIEIKRVFFESSPAIVRYFDPYAGTGTGIQSLLESFGFGQFSPGINFLLMPIYFDVQKVQAIELNDSIRKAAFSFDLVNNQLRLFPIPENLIQGFNDKLYFHYIKKDERNDVTNATPNNPSGSITNIMNVPYVNPVYSQINSMGRQWIRQYMLAICKEMLAYIRGKYQTTPIPGAEVTLNQNDLLADAREEKRALLEQLRLILDTTSRKTLLENQAAEADSIQKTLGGIALPIYIF